MMEYSTELFNSLVKHRMLSDDVRSALELTQSEFLSMMITGSSEALSVKLTRPDFARLSGLSVNSVYGYFASPTAADFRLLSDDTKIAMMWRVTAKLRLCPSYT